MNKFPNSKPKQQTINHNKPIMKIIRFSLILLVTLSCVEKRDKFKAPIAKKMNNKITTHGHTRIDNYFWMRLSDEQKEAVSPDTQTNDVLDYLNTENEYLKSVIKSTDDLQDSLYQEIVGRIKQDDESVPVTVNGYMNNFK